MSNTLTEATIEKITNSCKSFTLPPTVEQDDLVQQAIMIALDCSKDPNEANPAYFAKRAYQQLSGDGTVGRSNDNLFKSTGLRTNTSQLESDPLVHDNHVATDALLDLGELKTAFIKEFVGDRCLVSLRAIADELGDDELSINDAYEKYKAQLKRLLA